MSIGKRSFNFLIGLLQYFDLFGKLLLVALIGKLGSDLIKLPDLFPVLFQGFLGIFYFSVVGSNEEFGEASSALDICNVLFQFQLILVLVLGNDSHLLSDSAISVRHLKHRLDCVCHLASFLC